jgi:hypothetical protein
MAKKTKKLPPTAATAKQLIQEASVLRVAARIVRGRSGRGVSSADSDCADNLSSKAAACEAAAKVIGTDEKNVEHVSAYRTEDGIVYVLPRLVDDAGPYSWLGTRDTPHVRRQLLYCADVAFDQVTEKFIKNCKRKR